MPENKLYKIWMYWFIISNIADYISTIISLNFGNEEKNIFYSLLNLNIYTFWIFKFWLAIFFLYCFNFLYNKDWLYKAFIPYYLVFIDIYFFWLCYHNLSISIF